ncbi:MAG: nitroreductase family protein [Candidatus Aenigmatarchaeota archaeon]
MNIFEAILTRKVALKFEKKEIDDKLIGLILHAATYAPSAGKLEEWRFIVVKDEKLKEKLSELAYNERLIKDAALNIVACADFEAAEAKYKEKGINYALQDISFASMIILLSAKALGLGSALIRNFKVEEVAQLLDLPDSIKPALIIPLGYVVEEKEIERLPYENLTYLNQYGRKYEIEFKPILKYLKDFFEKRKGEKEKRKLKLDFMAFLKKLAR